MSTNNFSDRQNINRVENLSSNELSNSGLLTQNLNNQTSTNSLNLQNIRNDVNDMYHGTEEPDIQMIYGPPTVNLRRIITNINSYNNMNYNYSQNMNNASNIRRSRFPTQQNFNNRNLRRNHRNEVNSENIRTINYPRLQPIIQVTDPFVIDSSQSSENDSQESDFDICLFLINFIFLASFRNNETFILNSTDNFIPSF